MLLLFCAKFLCFFSFFSFRFEPLLLFFIYFYFFLVYSRKIMWRKCFEQIQTTYHKRRFISLESIPPYSFYLTIYLSQILDYFLFTFCSFEFSLVFFFFFFFSFFFFFLPYHCKRACVSIFLYYIFLNADIYIRKSKDAYLYLSWYIGFSINVHFECIHTFLSLYVHTCMLVCFPSSLNINYL